MHRKSQFKLLYKESEGCSSLYGYIETEISLAPLSEHHQENTAESHPARLEETTAAPTIDREQLRANVVQCLGSRAALREALSVGREEKDVVHMLKLAKKAFYIIWEPMKKMQRSSKSPINYWTDLSK